MSGLTVPTSSRVVDVGAEGGGGGNLQTHMY